MKNKTAKQIKQEFEEQVTQFKKELVLEHIHDVLHTFTDSWEILFPENGVVKVLLKDLAAKKMINEHGQLHGPALDVASAADIIIIRDGNEVPVTIYLLVGVTYELDLKQDHLTLIYSYNA